MEDSSGVCELCAWGGSLAVVVLGGFEVMFASVCVGYDGRADCAQEGCCILLRCRTSAP